MEVWRAGKNQDAWAPAPPRMRSSLLQSSGTLLLQWDFVNEYPTPANADGSNPVRLTNNPAYDGDPAWSPDGTKIAFDSARTGHFEIYVMNADGSHLVRLTHDSRADGNPAWSPDGKKIAFVASDDAKFVGHRIYVMDADGSHQLQLTAGAAPAWSPDGTMIAFEGSAYANDGIYITNNSEGDWRPNWGPEK